MKRISTIVLFCLLTAYIIGGTLPACSSEIGELFDKVEKDIKTWQISSASFSVDQAVKIAETDAEKFRSFYLKSLVDFYKGDYQSANEYGEKALSNKEIE